MANFTTYILVTVHVGSSVDAVSKIETIGGVVQATSVFGPWDVVVISRSERLEDLGRVVREIRDLDEVTGTISLIEILVED